MKSTALEHLQPNLYAGRERAGKIAVFDVLDGKKDVEPKHGMRGTTRLVLLAMLVLAATGCATIGPASISHGRSTYNAVINRTEDEQILSMIVHQRYDETFGMLVVSNVTASLRGRATVGGNAGIGPSENYAGNLVPLSAEATYEENPTITYVPLRGEQFLQRMLAPLTAEQVLLLSRMSNDEIEVFRLLVRRANDLVNPLYSSRPANQDFDRFLDLYAQWREAGKLDIVKSPDGQFALLLHNYSAEESKAMAELLGMLRVEKQTMTGPTLLPLRFFVGSPRPNVIDFETPSALEVIDAVAAGVDVPREHLDKQLARDNFGTPPRQLIAIRSAKTRPRDASVAVEYHGWWFFIDGRDSRSKRSFMILRTLIGMRLDAAAPGQGAPVLTLPVGR